MEQLALSGLEAAIAACGELLEQQLVKGAELRGQEQLEAKARERAEQLAAGRCNFKTLPRIFTEPFRAELTVERHSVFLSNDYDKDSYEREITYKHPSSGEDIRCCVRIGKTIKGGKEYGVLTQAHQDVYYRILQLWGHKGYPLVSLNGGNGPHIGGMELSAYELLMHVWGKDSKEAYDRMRELLHQLTSIPIVLENHVDWRGLRNMDQFTLLGAVDWKIREMDNATGQPLPNTTDKVTIFLSPRITEGFLAKYTAIRSMHTALALGSDGKGTRRSPYYTPLVSFLESQLANKDEYNIRLEELAKCLGARAYRYKSQRKEKVLPALSALKNRLICVGKGQFKLDVSLRESEDGDDYVLVARKTKVELSDPEQMKM